MNGFQEAMAEALLTDEPDAAGVLQALIAQPGFAIYRNTVAKGCCDALEANFPTVARLVGMEWFRGAALAYARTQPPRDSRLLAYGDEGFADFLQSVPTAADLPYLAGVARLDTLWRASHVAADAPVLAPEALAQYASEDLVTTALRPHPATRWSWFDDLPVATIWTRGREAREDEELVWQGEGMLLTRSDGAVRWRSLSRGGCAFLDSCARGETLESAAQAALASDLSTDLALLLRQLLQAGAFTPSPSTRTLP